MDAQNDTTSVNGVLNTTVAPSLSFFVANYEWLAFIVQGLFIVVANFFILGPILRCMNEWWTGC